MERTGTFFLGNRQRLMESLNGELFILTAHTGQQQRSDIAQPFVQEANFWWLTGIEEPDWLLVIDGAEQKSWLVAPDIDGVHQVFDGSLPHSDAQRISGVDHVLTHEAGEALLTTFAKQHREVYTLGKDPHARYYTFSLNPAQPVLRRRLRHLFSDVKDCRDVLASLRAIKQPYEIAAIKSAVALTLNAFRHIKTELPALSYEYEVQAEFDHRFKHQNVDHAYAPIIAGGANAVTLHYNRNTQKLRSGLVLMDVGARVDGYAADITRTYAKGALTRREQDVHTTVTKAHHQIVRLIKPAVSVQEYHEQVDSIMKDAIASLGLLNTPSDYRRYFPHAISHGLGIDVHDALGSPETFLPGMVLTVEPGIYIPEEGIGVRIEDDILITDTGYENLSANLSHHW